MRAPRASLPACSLVALLGAGCGDDVPHAAPDPTCPPAAPTRLWAPPNDQRPLQNGDLLTLGRVGESLLFLWGTDIGSWRMYTADACGEAVEAIDPDDDLVDRFVRFADYPGGQLLYGYRDVDRGLVLLDRLEVDGIDAPTELGAFDDGALQWWDNGDTHVFFVTSADPSAGWMRAAGLGGRQFSLWRHDGAPSGELEWYAGPFVDVLFHGHREPPFGVGPALTLGGDGELRLYDTAGVELAARSGVRHVDVAPGGRRLAWQQIGDDVSEPVFVLDLDTGVDIPVGANVDTARSWGRVHTADTRTGTWKWVDDRYLGLVGPDGTLVAAHDAVSGESLAVPEHEELITATTEGFWLRVAGDPGEKVGALWDPRDGELFEWYRQPESYPFTRIPQIDGDRWRYVLLDQGTLNTGSWWNIDRSTGAWTRLLPLMGVTMTELDDGRILTSLEGGSDGRTALMLVDPATQVYLRLADRVNWGFVHLPDRGVYWLDSLGGDMGLWFSPIPAP